ncbi:hypothetical protein ACP275_08G243300 [Erythranthe tilingii]
MKHNFWGSVGSLVMPERTMPSSTAASESRIQPPLLVTCIAEGSHLGQPRARTGDQYPPPDPAPTEREGGGGGATQCVTPRQTCPRPSGFGRNLRSKTRWFTGFCNSHQVSHFATFFIDARAEISVAESRFDIQDTSRTPAHVANEATGGRTLR